MASKFVVAFARTIPTPADEGLGSVPYTGLDPCLSREVPSNAATSARVGSASNLRALLQCNRSSSEELRQDSADAQHRSPHRRADMTFVGCKKTHNAGNVPIGRSQPTTTTHGAKILAAAVLTKEEVALVQSTPIAEVKSTENFEGRYVVSQCFYNAIVANKSVSFSLTEPSSGGGANANPREYWDKIIEQIGIKSVQLHEVEKKEGDPHSAGEEPEGKRAIAKKIDGVGEQAYWVRNRVGGTLYVGAA